jgi:uncharacterized protein YjbI with pentapeptide repeats/energy-coupling factor transporter ATP-binding protein EcfA2
MIQANRAPVKPRVISPETGDAIRLEDIFLESKPNRIIEIVGGAGAGKTTALAHLAAVLPAELQVVFVDGNHLDALAALAKGASVVVFSERESRTLRGVASFRLAPWDNDDLLEYLLAMHPQRCGSVMNRLKAAPDRHLPDGAPELWRIVLDRMAHDESLTSITEALRQELARELADAIQRTWAEQICLADMLRPVEPAAKSDFASLGKLFEARALRLLRHDAVRLLLATDRLVGLLESEDGDQALKLRMLRELVEAAAAVASPEVIERLSHWISGSNTACHPMAASILHAAGKGWAPVRKGWPPGLARLPHLAGAYLNGARWKAADLKKANLAQTDLSSSNLTEAILDKAIASKADFSFAVLHGASLLKIRARGANFSQAVLTSIAAHSADFRGADFAEADLTGAQLAQADFGSANLSTARLVGADLSGSNLTGANIAGADFSSCDLSRSILDRLVLREARLAGAKFEHAKLNECDLEYVDLPDADFSEALLHDALLTGSRMPRANFASASLHGARLADIDWEGADLRKSDLSACTFHLGSSRSGLVGSPIASEGSRMGFYSDEFDQQTYRPPEEIRKANLRGADLRDAYLGSTDFYLVDLREAKYSPRQFDHLRRCGAILFDRE